MEEAKKYLTAFLSQNRIEIPSGKLSLFDEFIANEKNINAVRIIQENQKMIMKDWTLKTRIDDIISQTVLVPNATVNKKYEVKIDFNTLGWDDIVYFEIKNLEDSGLKFNNEEKLLFGTPVINGDVKIKLLFKVEGEAEDAILNEKTVTIIINPDPKSLWKNIESDINDAYWKEDNSCTSGTFLDKSIVIASKRGRSHANVGSFRDDDFAFKNMNETGWSVICVADGAGSYPLAKQGSKLACEAIIAYFEANFTKEYLLDFDQTLLQHHNKTDVDSSKKISHFIYNNLSKAAYFAHKK
ncbi:MAG TPA: protein phosphatase 2C domain-containing protein, partial [Flavobacterium sp.]